MSKHQLKLLKRLFFHNIAVLGFFVFKKIKRIERMTNNDEVETCLQTLISPKNI